MANLNAQNIDERADLHVARSTSDLPTLQETMMHDSSPEGSVEEDCQSEESLLNPEAQTSLDKSKQNEGDKGQFDGPNYNTNLINGLIMSVKTEAVFGEL